jgi:hypothetical protein
VRVDRPAVGRRCVGRGGDPRQGLWRGRAGGSLGADRVAVGSCLGCEWRCLLCVRLPTAEVPLATGGGHSRAGSDQMGS